MKWYACLNEDGLSRYSAHLGLALSSCRRHTELEPHIIFDGEPQVLLNALRRSDFVVHSRRSSLWPDIVKVPERPGYKHRIAAGAFLRLEIGAIEREDPFVLYTDCDVMFLGGVDVRAMAPASVAAAPEDDPENWSFFNSGVMLLNVKALRRDRDALLQLARTTLGTPHFYDQGVYNSFFQARWDRLPLAMNWKPYWGVNPDASILHFHGPKLDALQRLIEGVGDGIVHDAWRDLFDRNAEAYAHYYRTALALQPASALR